MLPVIYNWSYCSSEIRLLKYFVLFLCKRSIFQTFWKQDSCREFLFFELETSNFGYLLIFKGLENTPFNNTKLFLVNWNTLICACIEKRLNGKEEGRFIWDTFHLCWCCPVGPSSVHSDAVIQRLKKANKVPLFT